MSLRSFLRSLPDRLHGRHIEPQEHFVPLSSKAKFTPDQALQARIEAARMAMGVQEPKRLIESQPDSFVKPINYDDWL